MRMKTLIILGSLVAASTQCAVITNPSLLPGLAFDCIIVGAGTAGLTLANRLSATLSTTVLVLEAGGRKSEFTGTFFYASGNPGFSGTVVDWNFTVAPQFGLNDRTFPLLVGRVLGGSSSVNYLVHQYGTNDEWNRMANTVGEQGWAWANMKQYVTVHGRSIRATPPLNLPGVNQTTDTHVIATTTHLAEFPYNNETSGLAPSILGFGFIQSSISESGSRRTSVSTAYLTPVITRANLTVLLNATVRKLVETGINETLKSFRQVKFSYTSTAPITTVTARREVILSAGAIGTPHILMLSGIRNHLNLGAVGIEPSLDLGFVGPNLMDSPFLPFYYTVTNLSQTALDNDLRNETEIATDLVHWKANSPGGGILSNGIVNMFGFMRLPAAESIFSTVTDPPFGPLSPHYEILPTNFFLPILTSYPASGNFLTFVTTLRSPTSRGTLQIASSDPFTPPLIDPRYMTTDFDIFTMREGVRAVQRFISAPTCAQYGLKPLPPNVPASASNDTVVAYIRSIASTIFHPSGTTPMSSIAQGFPGVVNPNLTVKGADGLAR